MEHSLQKKQLENYNKAQQFLFCDKILTAYVLCINKFAIDHKDCNHIYDALSKLELCRENNDVLIDKMI
jgi:hypothetical protein